MVDNKPIYIKELAIAELDLDLKYDPAEIEQLVADLAELRETFEIVNSMVEDQSTSIETLENHVDNVCQKVALGSEDLKRASKYNKAKNKKKKILLGLGILAINIPLAPVVGLQFSLPISLAITGGMALRSK